MSYWAQLDNENQVIQVIVADSYKWLLDNLGGRWVETIEDNFAGIGWTYIEDLGFHSPQPFPSWILNDLIWEAPKLKPEGDYYWSEEDLDWVIYVENKD
jgi:hypothetical protein